MNYDSHTYHFHIKTWSSIGSHTEARRKSLTCENSPKSKFSHSCRIHHQNSSKHDRIFQKLTFPIKEVLLLFFLENCLFFSFFCVNRPIFQSSRSVDLKRFFSLLLVGDRHTLATSTSLASVQPWTVFNSIAPILSVWTASKKTFVSFLLLSFIAANLHATPLTSQSINTRAKSTCWATCWSEIWSSGAVRDNQMRMDIRYGWLCGMILLRESCFKVKVEYLLYYCQM